MIRKRAQAAARPISELGPAALFQFFRSARPVLAQQAAKRAVGQQFSSGLAARTVVRLVGRVPDPLDLSFAARTWLAVTAMDSHLIAKRGDLLGELRAGFFSQIFSPLRQRLLCGLMESLYLLGLHALRQQHGRELGVEKYFI